MKQFLLIATSFIVVLGLFAVPVQAQETGTKAKEVALVYDDSGSMRVNENANGTKTPIHRWQYANYALQSFISLLDEKDSFFYVPMSKPSQFIPVQLASKERQVEINNIRSWKEAKNTPFDAVVTAINELKARAEKEQKKEYWLIVLTDGAFNKLEEQQEAISNTLKSFMTGMQKKGITTHAVLITVESSLQPSEQQQMELFKSIWKETTDGTIIPSEDDQGIIDSINTVAAMMTNRDSTSSINDGLQVKLSNNEAIVTSIFPLTRLTIVQQINNMQSVPLLQKVEFANKSSSLNMAGPFEIITPVSTAGDSPLIQGYIAHLEGKNGVLSPGVYNLHFNTKAIHLDKMKVLGEPALDYAISLYRKDENGTLSKDTKTFFESSPMVMEVSLLEKGTNKKLQLTGLDVESLFTATYSIEGKEEKLTWNKERNAFQYEFTMPSQAVTGEVDVRVKGLYKQTKEIKLQPMSKRQLDLQLVTGNWLEKVTELASSEPIVLQPTVNGQPMTETELKKVMHNVKLTLSKQVPYTISQHNNQIFITIRPDIKGMLNITKTGDIEATAELTGLYPGEHANVVFPLTIQDVSFIERNKDFLEWVIPTAVLVIIAGALLIGWLVRPRFNRKGLLYVEMRQMLKSDLDDPPEPELLVTGWLSHFIGVPYRAERKTIQSLHLIARKGTNAIWIAKESQLSGMIIDGSRLDEEDAGKEVLPLYPNQTVIIDRGYCTEVYRYECE
ncbi:vWA domain-containing protein [Bacillus sp. 165]|uniref:vWA domain-containing protein n=1 Tax=Bacillus sp. 165 TaxID=1529117 RepID=UPI001ADA8F4E|nr:vWA domain-containing protein [Bacillus sp. 165]MBO9129101.1 VWA domain-containing protein [Bacillus sp. 165]